MSQTFRRALAIAVLLGAWALVGRDHPPLPLTMAEAYAAPSRAEAGSDPARADKPPHDLSALRVFTKVILYVKENYVDPKRVKPKEMMFAALDYVEKAVPDVMVDGTPESGKIKLEVNGKSKTFEIGHVDSMWKMNFTLKDLFEFIAKNMRSTDDSRDVEYAAVNGMLSTLDPHSVLLRPEMYREMKLTTKGEFGGLGFVIQMKEGNLTVVKVLPKTPAYRAGIKKDDLIRKIGEESTVNMDLNEAVSKLRGPVDSKITITVDRKSWEKPQPITVARAMISIESVQSKLLAKNVGYVRLKNFQGNTTRDLQAALTSMAEEARASGGMKGLVLDLRGNPGGLLDQAIQVSDLFVSAGTIVATVGFSDKLREEKKAHADEGDDALPIAVLVNSGSASASEIVAGALKNLNRAVIIGRQTFGKGSVQVLYDFPDESALKLTIAKYLTPGDVSIQEVGIIPDIELIPARVTADRVNVFAPRKSVGEADLDHHFGNPSSQVAAKKRDDVLNREKPIESMMYLKEEPKPKEVAVVAPPATEPGKGKPAPRKEKARHGEADPLLDVDTGGGTEELDDQLDAESQDEVKEDFEVQFARDFVLKAPQTDRTVMLKAGYEFIAQKRTDEEHRIDAAIAALGLDWTAGASPKKVELTGTLKPNPGQTIVAGESMDFEVTVENRGAEPLFRVHAYSDSENPYLDRREFLFGKLAPGEKKSWKVPVKLPKDLTSRRDDVTVRFFDDRGALPDTVVSELSFSELPRPSFAFGWQVVDDCAECNGDGRAQRGETVQVLLDVKNAGRGRAMDSFAQIKNAADQNIFIEKGRFKLGEIGPGETRTARFILRVMTGYKAPTFPLKLAIVDEPLEEYTADRLEIPVAADGAPPELRKNTVKLGEGVVLFDSASASARALTKLDKGAVLNSSARFEGFVRVELGEDRFAFVRAADAKDQKGGKPTLTGKELSYEPIRTPPEITLAADSATGPIVSEGEHFALTGKVSSARNLLDVYVLVNDQKVFFTTAPSPANPGDPIEVKFSTDVPLKEGNNNVMIVARGSSEFASRKTLVIRRRPAAVAAQKAAPAQPN